MEGRTMEGKKQRKPQETYLETCQETYLLLRSFLPKGRTMITGGGALLAAPSGLDGISESFLLGRKLRSSR